MKRLHSSSFSILLSSSKSELYRTSNSMERTDKKQSEENKFEERDKCVILDESANVSNCDDLSGSTDWPRASGNSCIERFDRGETSSKLEELRIDEESESSIVKIEDSPKEDDTCSNIEEVEVKEQFYAEHLDSSVQKLEETEGAAGQTIVCETPELCSCQHSPDLDGFQQTITICQELVHIFESASIGLHADASCSRKVLSSCPLSIYYRLASLSFQLASVSLKTLFSMDEDTFKKPIAEDYEHNQEKVLDAVDQMMCICQMMCKECQYIHKNYFRYALSEEGSKESEQSHDEVMAYFQNAFQISYELMLKLNERYEAVLNAGSSAK
ncbi:hypothetical protein C0J52_18376 [Blattella germanica]|nr:hypothetical protein C0J52_18376 [Blattella germanica]